MLLLFRSLRVALRKEGRLLARSTLNQNGVSVSCHRICHNKLPVFDKSGKLIQKRHKNKKEEKTKSSHSFERVKYLEISMMN